MKKKITFMYLILLALIGFTQPIHAQVNGDPAEVVSSTAEKPVYYYIESASDGTVTVGSGTMNYLGHLVYVPNATSGTIVKHDLKATIEGNTISLDNAIWQVIVEDGITKLQNKGTGLFLDEARWGRATVTAPFTAMPLNEAGTQFALKNSNQPSPAVAWNSGANGNYLDRWGNNGPNSQTAWYFILADEASESNYVYAKLASKIAEAAAIIENTVEGEETNNYPIGSQATLQAAIDAAQTVLTDEASVEADFNAAEATLDAAIETYMDGKILPYTLSDGETEHWYHIVFQRYNADLALQDNGDDAVITVEALDIAATEQLWKLEAGTEEGQFIFTSHAGRKIGWNGTRFVAEAAGTEIRVLESPSSAYSGWELQRIGSATMGMNPIGGSSAGKEIGEWNIGDGGNVMAFTTATDFLKTDIAIASELLENTVEGAGFGQFPTEARTPLTDAIAAAQEAVENEALTRTELIEAITAINAAIDTYKGEMTSYVALLSTNPDNYRWYTIKSNAVGKAYAEGKVISQGMKVAGERFTYLNPDTPVLDGQLFRFELNEDSTAVVGIVNKLGNYLTTNGSVSATNPGDEFTLPLLSDGISFNIKPSTAASIHAQEANAVIVNWAGGAGSASAWILDFVKENAMLTPERTVTVSTNNAEYGSAVITDTELSTITTDDQNISVTAIAVEGSLFTSWINTDTSEELTTRNPYIYSDDEDLNLTAIFRNPKADLMAKITEATALKESTTEGTELFNYTVESRELLQAATDSAQIVYNNEASVIADFEAGIAYLADAVVAYKKSQIMPFMLSDETSMNWYFIRNLDKAAPRGNLAINFSAAGEIAQSSSFREGDLPTMWKVVTNADVSSYGLVCTVDGVDYYIDNEVKLSTTPFTDWKLVKGTVDGVTGWRFEYAPGGTLTAVIHQRNTDPYELMHSWKGADIASLWSFETYGSLLELNVDVLGKTVAGANPGNFSVEAQTALQEAYDNALVVVNDKNSTKAAVAAAFTDVRAKIADYEASVVLPKISTEGNEVWYFFQGTRPANTYMTSKGAGALLRSEGVIPDDTQLWKIVANTSGTANGVALINKATGEYLNANVANDTNVGSVVEMPTNNLKIKLSDIYTDKVARFWVEHSEGSTPTFRLHAGSGNVMNWSGNAYDNSSWRIIDYSSALRVFLQDGINSAGSILENTTEGSEFGQYPADARTSLSDAIPVAQAAIDNESATNEEIIAATVAINDAIVAYRETVVDNLSALLSENENSYRWYRLNNKMYAEDDYMTAFGKVEGNGIEAMSFDAEDESQLWRFELNVDETSVKLVNRANKLAVKENGTSTQATFVTLDAASEFIFKQVGNYWAIGPVGAGEGTTYLHRAGHKAIVGWSSGADASQWSLEFVEETIMEGPTRTLTVVSANAQHGTAVITGTEETTITTNAANISVTAMPADEYEFIGWTTTGTEDVVSMKNPYTYTGETDISLTANFIWVGTYVIPEVSTVEEPVYYHIYSASNGSHSFAGYSHNTLGNVMISADENAVKIKHDRLEAAPTANHAQWQILEEEGVQVLKNKATGMYMFESKEVRTTAQEFEFANITGSEIQYKLRNIYDGDNSSYAIAWKTNLLDRLNIGDEPNSLMSWYFVEAPADIPDGLDYNVVSKYKVYEVNGSIRISSPDSESMNIAVYSVSGQNLYRTRTNNQSIVLDKNFASGAYIVRINQEVTKVMVK